MTDQDREYAIMEAHRIAACEPYFEARPALKSDTSDRVFDAAFERGWKAALAAPQTEPVAWMHPPTQTVTVSAERPDDRASWRPLVFGDEAAPQPAAPVQPAHEQRRDAILEHYTNPAAFDCHRDCQKNHRECEAPELCTGSGSCMGA